MSSNRKLLTVAAALVTAGVLLGAEPSLAQEAGQLAAQNLRPYWLVFIAYTIPIVLMMGWAVSIARRLARLEERLGE